MKIALTDYHPFRAPVTSSTAVSEIQASPQRTVRRENDDDTINNESTSPFF
ncbi:hypothetical protein [Haladaptatus halobius]|uniref:hypothetical protein n=1 Tax=Haladaptatus halobius TaxID=2884875 RepID=UPI001D0B893B|nr:hypothetical protein [Haladaptatus halobius]